MKYIIAFLLLASAAISSQAQINPEHTYYYNLSNSDFYLNRVDSNSWKYVLFNRRDSVTIYNIDHTLERIFVLPIVDTTYLWYLYSISRGLFQKPNAGYEIFVMQGSETGRSRIYDENRNVLFGCEYCTPRGIVNTDHGAKLLIDYAGNDGKGYQTTVFSLPGILPGGTIKLNAGSPSSMIAGNAISTSAYPNPSNGQIRIEYQLPDGVAQGELMIADISGKEVKRLKVGNAFNDILIDRSDLPSGSYFYKLITSKGESEVKRIVILK